MSVLAPLVSALADGSLEVVDLTSPLGPDTVILELPEPFANTRGLSSTPVARFDDAGPVWAWNDIEVGEHAGTHLDAPTHWITGRDGDSVDRIPPSRLVGPAVVLDITAEAAADPDHNLTPADFEAWVAENGEFPQGTWLLVRTGWSARSGSREEFLNLDESGSHTPGITAEGAKWLADNPAIVGYGVETVGIDSGQAGAFDPPFPAHHYLLGADTYGITSLRNLDLLPATGATVVVAPLRIVDGTGSPSRVFALVER